MTTTTKKKKRRFQTSFNDYRDFPSILLYGVFDFIGIIFKGIGKGIGCMLDD